MTPEREAEIRRAHKSAVCSAYVGRRCNSGRCPKHGAEAMARRDLLAALDAERAARQAAERDAAEARRDAIRAQIESDGTLSAALSERTRERDEAQAALAALADQVRGRALREVLTLAGAEARVFDARGFAHFVNQIRELAAEAER